MADDLAVSPDLLAARSSPFGALSGAAPAAAIERQPATNLSAIPAASAMQPAGNLASREGTIRFWMQQGVPQHVAAGIADRVNAESGFKPSIPGDAGTSAGLYQHHADRLTRLQQFAASQGKPWNDPGVQHQFALSEVRGGDAIAAKHWQEIVNAPDQKTAAMLWDRYFERSAGGPGSASGGMAGHRIGGRFAGMGPQPGSLGAAMAPMRLAGGEPASSLSPGPLANLQLQAQPQQAATASPAPIARHPVAPLQPIPIPPAPNLHKGYQEALASILNGQRRGFGSIFG
jgi:hypothetical protein